MFEYSELLDRANHEPDSCVRMALILAFIFSSLSVYADRQKKPFTSYVGETFDFISEEKNIKFLAEKITNDVNLIFFFKYFYLILIIENKI